MVTIIDDLPMTILTWLTTKHRAILDSGFTALRHYYAVIGNGAFKLPKWMLTNVQTTCVCSQFYDQFHLAINLFSTFDTRRDTLMYFQCLCYILE